MRIDNLKWVRVMVGVQSDIIIYGLCCDVGLLRGIELAYAGMGYR